MTLIVQEDENGDLYLEFTQDQLNELGWKPGDTLKWILEDNKVVVRHS